MVSAGAYSGFHVPVWPGRPNAVHVRHHADHHEPERSGAVPSDQVHLLLL